MPKPLRSRNILAFLVLFITSAHSARSQGNTTAPIPQLTPGVISTIAGKNYTGCCQYTGDGGPALNAQLYGPQSVILDATGNYFIADGDNNVIRVVNNQSTAISVLGVTIQPGDIQTVAGVYSGTLGGSYGGDGGPAGNASFASPYQIRFDKNGNLFIADYGNFRVRAINMQTTAVTLFGVTIQAGNIDTVAGNNTNGAFTTCPAKTDNVGDGCPALQSGVGLPEGIAFDAAGNLYIADYGDDHIRRVDVTTGIITSVAGNGILNFSGDGGNPLQAELFDPVAVEFDAQGNIYILETGSARVRVVNTQATAITIYGVTIQPNTIETVAGSGTAVANQSDTSNGYSGDGGPATQAHLDNPQAIVLDPANNLYISDQSNSLIRKVDAQTGTITTIAGNFTDLGNTNGRSYTGDGGPATAAGIANPAYMTFDPLGNLLFAEFGNEVIRKITIASSVVNFPDTYPGSLSAAQTVTLQNVGNGALTISSIALGGANPASFSYGTTCSPTLAAGASCTFAFTFAPSASGPASATLTIAESTPVATQTIALNGTGSSTVIAQLSVSTAPLAFGSQTVGTASAQQIVMLTNSGTAPFSLSGTAPSLVTIIGVNAGDFTQTNNCGTALAAGSTCTINVSFVPQSVGPLNAFLAIEGDAKNAPQLISLSGTGTPIGGGSGGGSSPVLQVIPGVVTTVAGNGFDAGDLQNGGGYTGDGGPAVGAELESAAGAAVDTAGNLYFGDIKNNVIRFVNMQGSPVTVAGVTVQPGDIQTIAGNGFGAGLSTGGYSGDGGPALSAELYFPSYVTLDHSGNIFFADNSNRVIRVVNPHTISITVNGVTIPAGDVQTVLGIQSGGPVCPQAVDAIGDGCAATSAVIKGGELFAFDASGNLIFADGCYNVVRAVNMGNSPTTIAGVSIQPGQVQIIAGVLNSTGDCKTTTFGGDGGPALGATFTDPAAVGVDPAGNIYVLDADDARIRAINTQSNSISIFGVPIDPGTIQTVVGSGNFGYSGDFGPANMASMTLPSGLKFDAAGNLYFADTLNNVIREVFASTGIIRTVAGNGAGAIQVTNNVASLSSYFGGYTGDGGAATSAEFFGPLDMSIDLSGNLYVADYVNRVVRQVSATPAGFSFPDTMVGTTSAPEIYTFSNISAQSITFTGLTISPNFKQVPSGLTDCTATIVLPSAGTCQLALAFDPSIPGPLTGVAQTTNSAGVQAIPLSGTGITAGGAVLQSIAVTPATPSISNGSTQQFTATGIFSDGSMQNITSNVTWASATASVATINPSTGLATSTGIGSTQITATQGSIVSPPITLTVTSATVTLLSIAVTPSNPSIPKGTTQQFTATGTYSDNSTQNITSSVTWASATQSVATIVSNSGLATGVGTGTSQITAALSGVTSPSDTLTVTAATLVSIAVTPSNPSIAKGTTQQFTATGTYSDNSTQNITLSVTWASATQSVATIVSNSGLATGVGTGTSQITAALSGVTSPSDTLTVTAATLVSIAVTPSNPSIAKGTTQQFTATGTYSDNSTQNITSNVTWASATQSVATIVANSGLATGVGTGTSQITAALSGVTSPGDTLTITIPTLVSIAVTPMNPSIAKGLTQQFSATGTYTDNSTQSLTSSVTWASATQSVATIGSSSGLAMGVGIGTSQITATLNGVTSLGDTLTVTAAVLESIVVTPANPTILVNGTQTFTATGTYSDNSTQNLTSSANWASATPAVATIGTSTGVATGVSAGSSAITAAVGAIKSPSDTLTVDNLVPSIGSLVPPHGPAGASFTLTINGTNFVSTSTVSFNGKAETTSFVSGTQLTASIPAADMSTGGNVNVTITNPAPGGGTSTAVIFTIDDFSLAGPGSTVDVTPGQATPLSITIMPTANGFANAVQLSVSGLPTGMTAQFSQSPVTPGTTSPKITLSVTATAATAVHPASRKDKFPIAPMGLLLSVFSAGTLLAARRTRWAANIPAGAVFALWLIVIGGLGISLSGCTAGFPLGNNATPAGNYTITVIGTSGTVQHSTPVTLSVE